LQLQILQVFWHLLYRPDNTAEEDLGDNYQGDKLHHLELVSGEGGKEDAQVFNHYYGVLQRFCGSRVIEGRAGGAIG